MVKPANSSLSRGEWCVIGIGKVWALLLEVGHGIQDGIVFVAINAAMPSIGARFGDDIHNRAGVASIFRAKLIGDQNILLNKFAVSHEKSWAAHAIVVVVLTIDLLVIVATAKSVYRKALPPLVFEKPLSAWRKQRREQKEPDYQDLHFPEGPRMWSGRRLKRCSLPETVRSQ